MVGKLGLKLQRIMGAQNGHVIESLRLDNGDMDETKLDWQSLSRLCRIAGHGLCMRDSTFDHFPNGSINKIALTGNEAVRTISILVFPNTHYSLPNTAPNPYSQSPANAPQSDPENSGRAR